MLKILTLLILIAFFRPVFAQVDSETQDLLIDKLTKVYLNLPAADEARKSIVLRLGDLHAERARQASLKELNSGCTVCEAGQADRKKSIHYYEEVMPTLSQEQQLKVQIQIAHLSEMLGDESKALLIYKKVAANNTQPAMAAEAQLSMGEIFYKKSQYSQALDHYKEVLKIGVASKGLAAYRLAWCQFNLGKVDESVQVITMILKNNEYLNRSATTQVQSIDKQFQEEVSRDLVTFMAKAKSRDVQSLYNLSPETTKLDNLFSLATELERLGQVSASIDTWKFLFEKENRPAKKLAIKTHLAQNNLDSKNLAAANQEFENTLALWQSLHCEADKECEELKSRIKHFVTDYHRLEKKAPNEALLTNYQRYVEVFPREGDMQFWTAEVAKDLKKYKLAIDTFNKSVEINVSDLASTTDAKAKKEKSEMVESALLFAIECAELSQDTNLQVATADNYLKNSIDKKKSFEVQYQKAHMLYEKNNYAQASVALRELALSSQGALDVRKKAADLALDSLALLKDDTKLEQWAAEFSAKLPSAASEFQAIARKSILKQSAESNDSAAAWATLARYDIKTASDSEKASYFKNKLILAEKLQKYPEAREASEQLLKISTLSSEDREFALSRKAYLSELTLDFNSALQALSDMKPSGDKTLLKLGMYASLAQKDPKPFYRQFLNKTVQSNDSALVAALLVRESQEPLAEINKNKAVLSKNSELLAQLYLEAYALNKKNDIVKTVLADTKLAATDAGRVFNRIQILAEYTDLQAKFKASKIDSANQKKLTQSLKNRDALLGQIEKLAQRAISKSDWSSELLTLDLLAKESRRFYEELLSLPVPAGLSTEDEQTYLSLLSQQAAPHKQKADDVDKKVTEFWAQTEALEKMKSAYEKTDIKLISIANNEVALLKESAPDAVKAQMQNWKAPVNQVAGLNVADVEKAREAVRQSPMDKQRIEGLLEVEKKLGHEQMVHYLETRLSSLSDSSQKKSEGATL